MIKQHFYKIIAIAAIIVAIYSFKPNAVQYDYLTVLAQTTGNGKGLNISIGGRDFKQIDLDKANKGWYDFNQLASFLSEYESYGWQLEPASISYTVSPNGNAGVFAIMKKAK
jgi:hypothetical protein